jgi:hypothetical protein
VDLRFRKQAPRNNREESRGFFEVRLKTQNSAQNLQILLESREIRQK